MTWCYNFLLGREVLRSKLTVRHVEKVTATPRSMFSLGVDLKLKGEPKVFLDVVVPSPTEDSWVLSDLVSQVVLAEQVVGRPKPSKMKALGFLLLDVELNSHSGFTRRMINREVRPNLMTCLINIPPFRSFTEILIDTSTVEDTDVLFHQGSLVLSHALRTGYKLKEAVGTHLIITTPSGSIRHTDLTSCDCPEFTRCGSYSQAPCNHIEMVRGYLKHRELFGDVHV